MQTTKWYIVTGGPSSGKSKLIEALAFKGFAIRPESARIVIDEEISQGKDLSQIRADEKAFQRKVLQLSIDLQKRTPPEALIFFERGIPDSISYLKNCGGELESAIQASKEKKYQAVFLLDRLPTYRKDYARIESETEAQKLHESLYQTYKDLGYNVIRVPVMPISNRVEFVLSKI